MQSAPKIKGLNPKSHINITFLENLIEYNYIQKGQIYESANVVACLGKSYKEFGFYILDVPEIEPNSKISLLNNSITLASVTYTDEDYKSVVKKEEQTNKQENRFPSTIDFMFSSLDDNVLNAGLGSDQIEEIFRQNNQFDLDKIILKDKFTKESILNFYLNNANIIIYFVKQMDTQTMNNLKYLKDNKKSSTKIIEIHICDNVKEYSNQFKSFSQQAEGSKTIQKQFFTLRMNDYFGVNNESFKDEPYNTYFIEYLDEKNENSIIHFLYIDAYKDVLKFFLRQHLLYDTHSQKFDFIESFKSFMKEHFKRVGCQNVNITQNKINNEEGTLKISGIDDLRLTPELSSLSNAFQAASVYKITNEDVTLTTEYPLLNAERKISDIINERRIEGKENRFYVHKLSIEKGYFSIKITGYKENDPKIQELDEKQIYFINFQRGEFFVQIDLPPSDEHGLIILQDSPKIEPIMTDNGAYSGIIKITYPRVHYESKIFKII